MLAHVDVYSSSASTAQLIDCTCPSVPRYDASRCIDMGGRARVAAAAIQEALSELPEGATSRQVADSTAAAAEAAYDK
jgi:hypothetical protein